MPARLTPSKEGLPGSIQTPLLVEENALFQNTLKIKIWSWVPTGPETKKYCDSEGQQQFDRPTHRHRAEGRNLDTIIV
jgi:hypothetical protein